MNSSIDPRNQTKILRDIDSDVTITQPSELDLSSFISVGNHGIVTPEMMESAIETGYRDGWEQGFREAREKAEQALIAEREAWRLDQTTRLSSALDALATATEGFRLRQVFELPTLEDSVANAAIELATALLGRELELSGSPGRDAIARALALAPAGENVVLRLNASDVETLGCIDDLLLGRSFTVIADPSISTGDCLLDAKDCQVDARLITGIERVRQTMLGDRETRQP